MAYIGAGITRFNTADDLTVTDDAEIKGDLVVEGTADINGGTIDNTTIGGITPAAGTFTTFTSNGIDDNASATAVTLDSSGNVGIGTGNPQSPLDVGVGGSTSPTYKGNIRLLGGGLSANGGLEFVNSTFSNGYGWRVQAPDLGSGNVPIVFQNRANSTNWTERMRIDSSGNVGVNNNNPSHTLDVVRSSSSSSPIASFSGNSASTSNYVGVAYKVNDASASANHVYYQDFRNENSVPVTSAFATVDSNGSSSYRVLTTTAGSRTVDRRFNLADFNGNVIGIGLGSSQYAISGATVRIGEYRSANRNLDNVNTNTSLSTTMIANYAYRSNNSGFQYYLAYSSSTSDIEFNLRGDGQAYADGSWNGGGADYAEYFEWSDGNTSNEDRRGYTVVLDGNKVRKATDDDEASQIIGAVSATPCVIGDHADNKWSGKFLKDDFGNYIREEHNVVEWTETYTDDNGVEQEKQHSYEDWNIPEGIAVPDDATILTHDDAGNRFDHRKLNPNFDPDAEYITRENRPEWSPIGMMGKLRIRKGQPVGDRWIKMRDISDSVEEWLVR